MSAAGLTVCFAVLTAPEFCSEKTIETERDARHQRAKQVAEHQLFRVRQQQQHGRRREKRRVRHRCEGED